MVRICLLLLAAALLPAADFSARFEEIRQAASREELYALMWDLPKGGDLHNHLTLSISAELMWRVATDTGRPGYTPFYARTRFLGCVDSRQPFLEYQTVPRWMWQRQSECSREEYLPLASLTADQRSAWISAMILDKPNEGRDEFFEVIVARRQPMVRNLAFLYDAAAEHLKERVAEGLRYLETQFIPVNGQDNDGMAIPVEQGVVLLRQLLARADIAALPLDVRFQFIITRFNADAEAALERGYAFVSRNRDLWVGVNMVGREDNDKGYALRFLETARKLRRTYPGVHLSIHAGESSAPGRQIHDTLLVGAERIGHGINLLSDPDTYLLLRNGRTLVEINLVSNRLLQYVPDLTTHPFPEYLRTGVPVCLNTDDPGAWDSNFTDEYFTAVTTYNLTWEEIVRIGRNSLEYSFAEAALKARLLADYDKAVRRFEDKYGAGNWRETLRGVTPHASGYARRNLLK